jgi:integrase/recombinase XerC
VGIHLTDSVSYALEEWLNFHPCNAPGQPLITSLSHNCYGARIAGDSIYRIVQGYAEAAGITSGRQANERQVSPHRLRHSSTTAFLDASGGNLRAAQALSRHRNQNTLNLYDDNRRQEQKGASGMLEDLLAGTGGKTSD